MVSRPALAALTGLGLIVLLAVAWRIPVARSLPAHSQAGESPSSASVETAPGPEAADVKQRGVALGLFAEDVSFSYAPLLQEIAAWARPMFR